MVAHNRRCRGGGILAVPVRLGLLRMVRNPAASSKPHFAVRRRLSDTSGDLVDSLGFLPLVVF